VTQALWIGSILACTAFLPVFVGPVRRLRAFPRPLDEAGHELVGDGLAAEGALSGLEPMGISMPHSVIDLGHDSGEKGSDPGSDGRERQRGADGQHGGGK